MYLFIFYGVEYKKVLFYVILIIYLFTLYIKEVNRGNKKAKKKGYDQNFN